MSEVEVMAVDSLWAQQLALNASLNETVKRQSARIERLEARVRELEMLMVALDLSVIKRSEGAE